MLTLKNWDFKTTEDGMVYANGIVFGHYRLQDGDFIHTSEIQKIYLCNEDMYVIETWSGSLYQLFKSEMNPENADITNDRMKTLEFLDGEEMEHRLVLANEKFEAKRKIIDAPQAAAKENMDEDGLYLIMEYMNVAKAVLRRGDIFRELQPHVHVGMFQDSVLITDWKNGEVDFRYFPNYYLMEPYHWSDGLNYIYIHNIGDRSIVFRGISGNIECKANEVTKIEKGNYRGEGLFSPDAVNGKCFFSDILPGKVNDEIERDETITQDEINRLLGGWKE